MSNEIQVVNYENAMTRQVAEIDNQITTAKMYPRSVTAFNDDLTAMATLNKKVAASCFYSLPRGGTNIVGPSVRLAELAASAWGNLAYRAEVTKEDEGFVYATGFCRDLEKNTCAEFVVRRKITNKKGERYNDDMITTTANAACSIALRNAIFKIVPSVYIDEVFEQCKAIVCGDIKSLADTRKGWIDCFAKMGIDLQRILNVLKKEGVKDIDQDDIFTLNNLYNGIKSKEIDIDTAFPESFEESHNEAKKVKQQKAGSQVIEPEPEVIDENPEWVTKK